MKDLQQKISSLTLVLFLALWFLVGCGGSGTNTSNGIVSPPQDQVFSVKIHPYGTELESEKKQLVAKSGGGNLPQSQEEGSSLTYFDILNSSTDICLYLNNVRTTCHEILNGSFVPFELDLEPGTYEIRSYTENHGNRTGRSFLQTVVINPIMIDPMEVQNIILNPVTPYAGIYQDITLYFPITDGFVADKVVFIYEEDSTASNKTYYKDNDEIFVELYFSIYDTNLQSVCLLNETETRCFNVSEDDEFLQKLIDNKYSYLYDYQEIELVSLLPGKNECLTSASEEIYEYGNHYIEFQLALFCANTDYLKVRYKISLVSADGNIKYLTSDWYNTNLYLYPGYNTEDLPDGEHTFQIEITEIFEPSTETFYTPSENNFRIGYTKASEDDTDDDLLGDLQAGLEEETAED